MFDSSLMLLIENKCQRPLDTVDITSRKKLQLLESFGGFIQVHEKDAASVADIISEQLEMDKSFKDCRSLCYNNASVTSGCKFRVQQRLATVNSKAEFVNCDKHTLN